MITDACKLCIEQQELLRQQAITFRKGKTFQEIGALLNVDPDTVGHWYKRYQESSKKALMIGKRGPKNKLRRLTETQEQKVIESIRDNMPDQFKLGFALCARCSVAQRIKPLRGIEVPVRTMGDYLKRWGFTPQKPVKKAWEQNPLNVGVWLKEEYPQTQIKVRAKQENATIFCGNEAGIKNTTQHGRCYGPKGKTPVQPIPAKRVSLNMISFIANHGEVRFMLYESTMNIKVLIKFLRALIESTPGKVLLILDNLRVHHAKKAKRWLANQAVKLSAIWTSSFYLHTPQNLNNLLTKREVKMILF